MLLVTQITTETRQTNHDTTNSADMQRLKQVYKYVTKHTQTYTFNIVKSHFSRTYILQRVTTEPLRFKHLLHNYSRSDYQPQIPQFVLTLRQATTTGNNTYIQTSNILDLRSFIYITSHNAYDQLTQSNSTGQSKLT